MTKQINQIKTMTFKSIGIELPAGGGEYLNKVIALVQGSACGYTLKMTNYGESITLHGEFTAVNPETSEVFSSNTAYLAPDFAEMLKNKLDNRQDEMSSVDCVVEVLCVASDKAARGYTFVSRSPSTPEIVNKRQQIADNLLKVAGDLALPAPAKSAKK